MTMKLEAMPSPNGTNFEKLFVVKLPRGVDRERAQLALDSVMKRRADDRHDRRRADDADRRGGRDEEERDLYELRRKLEYVLSQNLSDEAYHAALDVLDEHLPGGQVYGDDETEREWYQHEDKPREPREPDGEDESEAEAEGRGLARRMETGDRRRRGARDRVLAHDSASDWLTELTSRIKPAISFR
jgi:hypothetical protein